jgi:predicted secreted protein
MSDATHGHGTTLAGSTAGTIGNVVTLTIDGVTIDIIDVTTMDSTNKWKEKLAGLKDPGRITFTVNYDGAASGDANTIHNNLGTSQTWTVTFPDTSTYAATGWIQHYTIADPVADKISQDVTIEFTGAPTFTDVAP